MVLGRPIIEGHQAPVGALGEARVAKVGLVVYCPKIFAQHPDLAPGLPLVCAKASQYLPAAAVAVDAAEPAVVQSSQGRRVPVPSTGLTDLAQEGSTRAVVG